MPVNLSLAKENYDRYAYARDSGHIEFLEKDKLCNDFFMGLQWEEALRKKLKAAGKPVMTINKVLATLNTVMGEQLQNRADISFKPAKEGSDEVAETLAKLFLSTSNANDYHDLESEMADDGFIGSRGFLDLRVDFDDNFLGSAKLELLNPRNVIISADATQYDPDTWSEIFISKWLKPSEIASQYNEEDAKHLAQRDRSEFEYGYDSVDNPDEGFGGADKENARYSDSKDPRTKLIRVIERQFSTYETVLWFVDPRTGDQRIVPKSWDTRRVEAVAEQYSLKTVRRKGKVIKWRVSADDTILFDEVSPMRHFTPIGFFPYFRRGRTMGLVENLVNPQEILNKVASQELHILNSSANGGWKIKTGSLSNMDPDELETRGAETGLVMELAEVGDAEKIQPNQIPTGLDRQSFKMEEYIKEVSTVSDSRQGMDRADVAAKAIQAKKASSTVNTEKVFFNLNRTRKILARNILDIYQGYYTEERIIQVTGEALGQQTEEIAINQVQEDGSVLNDLTVGTYTVVVTPVPTRDSWMESQFDEAMRMRESGVNIPDQRLIENSHLTKKNELLSDMNNEGAQQLKKRREEAEITALELENQEKEVEIQRKQAETQLASSRANKTDVDAAKIGSEIGQEGGGQQGAEELKIRLEHERSMREIELKHQLESEKVTKELRLKQAIEQEKVDILRETAVLKARQTPSPTENRSPA